MGKLIWLASYPKSGNTWLRIFLHNLLRNPDQPFDINSLASFSVVDSVGALYQRVDPRSPLDMSFEDMAKLRPLAHRLITTGFPDDMFVKTHNALGLDYGIPMITPEVTAGMVYVVRNPLDVLVSYAHHLNAAIDDTIAVMGASGFRTPKSAEWISEKMGSWSEHVASWTARPLPRLHVMRYEDMQEKSIETFGAFARWMGINPPRERLEKALRHSSFDEAKRQESEHGFREKSRSAPNFFRAGKVGEWREKLSPEQVARMVEAHRVQMQRFGYVPEGM